MKAESFVKLLRTIISEEVRKVVREELSRTLNENSNTVARTEPKISLRDKYKNLLNTNDLVDNLYENKVPMNKEGKPAIVNLSGNNLVNSILIETAQQMKADPQAGSFFEGLR